MIIQFLLINFNNPMIIHNIIIILLPPKTKNVEFDNAAGNPPGPSGPWAPAAHATTKAHGLCP